MHVTLHDEYLKTVLKTYLSDSVDTRFRDAAPSRMRARCASGSFLRGGAGSDLPLSLLSRWLCACVVVVSRSVCERPRSTLLNHDDVLAMDA